MLDRLVRDVMDVHMLILSEDVTVGETKAQVGPQQTIVVVDGQTRPVGILTPETQEHLSEPTHSLAHYRERYAMLALTSPGTTVQVALAGMMYDKAIRWYAVVDGTMVVGVIPPATLFQMSAEVDNESADGRGADRVPVLGSNISDIFGNPVASPPSLCYRCTTNVDHRFSPEQIQQRTSEGYALCPVDGAKMMAENPCRRGP